MDTGLVCRGVVKREGAAAYSKSSDLSRSDHTIEFGWVRWKWISFLRAASSKLELWNFVRSQLELQLDRQLVPAGSTTGNIQQWNRKRVQDLAPTVRQLPNSDGYLS